MSDRPHEETDASRPVNAIAALILTIAILFFFYFVRLALLPFVISGVTAFILSPLADRLAAATRMSRPLAGFLIFLGLAIAIGLALFFGGPSLAEEGRNFIERFQPIAQQVASRFLGDQPVTLLGARISAAQIAQDATDSLRQALSSPANLALVASVAFGSVFGFFMTMALLAYFLATGGDLMRGFVRLFPPHWRDRARLALAQLRPILWRYFFGVACVVVYAGSAAYIGLGLALHLRHAAFLAALTGFLEVLPVVGPALSAVLAGLVAIQQSKTAWEVVLYAIYATALRLSIDQLVGPLVLGKASRLHPTVVIFCFLAGGLLFGIPGVVLAAPAALALKVVLAIVYDETKRG